MGSIEIEYKPALYNIENQLIDYKKTDLQIEKNYP
jgi:hypothetical protein